MNKKIFTIVLATTISLFGCGEDDEGMGGSGGAGGAAGAGGAGGSVGPITWTGSDLQIVPPDSCEFFDDELVETLVMNISGNVLTVEVPGTPIFLVTEDYSPSDTVVNVAGVVENDSFPPCVAQLDDQLTLTPDDPSVSIDQNSTVSVEWFHNETDVSATEGACEGLWFVSLPCISEATFTITQ